MSPTPSHYPSNHHTEAKWVDKNNKLFTVPYFSIGSSRLGAYHSWLQSRFKCTHMIRHWDLSKWLCVTVRINKNYRGRNSSRRYRLGLQKGRVKVGEAVKHHTNQKLCLQIMLLCRHVQWYITYR